MVKKIINIFLVLVLSVQVLPVAQMGKMLFSNQFTEEIPHAVDVAKEGFNKAGGKSEFITTPALTLIYSFIYLTAPRPVIEEVNNFLCHAHLKNIRVEVKKNPAKPMHLLFDELQNTA